MWKLAAQIEPPESTYGLTRFMFLRSLGFICLIAFTSLITQLGPLIGKEGLLPADKFLQQIRSAATGPVPLWLELPTLFWFNCTDTFMYAMAYLGLGLSLLLFIGVADGILLALIWIIYISFVHVGQIFYGYGWEIMLLEACFLATFLVPLFNPRPFPPLPPSKTILWFYRWMVFRVMLGAGLIKLRGDPCWRELTCLSYHFETQPIPNPISWYLHQLPPVILKLGVLWNHAVELIVPFFIFGARRLRMIGGWLLIGFQLFLIVSGNLSFLNWLTIVICIPLFDDQALQSLLPKRWVLKAAQRAQQKQTGLSRRIVIGSVAALLLVLSVNPIVNMLSPNQIMNTSFDPFHLMNTYGAFGSVGKIRYEIIIQGTQNRELGPNTQWKEYEFWAKPGDVQRRPPFIAPYQPRLDWQIWFAAMSTIEREPWLVHLIYKLLQNDPGALRLLAKNPFPDRRPTYIRVELYEYHFTRLGESPGTWWKRKRVDTYLRPVYLNDPHLRGYLRAYGLE